jgi:hypothetical protein
MLSHRLECCRLPVDTLTPQGAGIDPSSVRAVWLMANTACERTLIARRAAAAAPPAAAGEAAPAAAAAAVVPLAAAAAAAEPVLAVVA